jgi:hypothetical protein
LCTGVVRSAPSDICTRRGSRRCGARRIRRRSSSSRRGWSCWPPARDDCARRSPAAPYASLPVRHGSRDILSLLGIACPVAAWLSGPGTDHTWGPILQGWVLADQGQDEEGMALMRQDMVPLQATGVRLRVPYHLALEAETCGKSGRWGIDDGNLPHRREVCVQCLPLKRREGSRMAWNARGADTPGAFHVLA